MSFFSKAAGFWSTTWLKKSHSKVFSVILSICDEHHSVKIAHIGYFHRTEGRLKYCLLFLVRFLKWTITFDSLFVLLKVYSQ